MDYPKEKSTSLYDYSDKSVPQAAYAAIAYGLIALGSALLEWLQFVLYHRPGRGGWTNQGWLSQQYIQHTPLVSAIGLAFGVVMGAISGVLSFFILRRSKVAIVLMLLLVIIPQLYTWLIVHSIGGSLVSIVVAAFLIRGAVRIFERPEQDEASAPKL
jgi:hypothetical protein